MGLGLLQLILGLSGGLTAWQKAIALGRDGEATLAGLWLWIVALVVGAYWMGALMWFALAGVIGVLIHVEEYTRATAQYVARMAVHARVAERGDDD